MKGTHNPLLENLHREMELAITGKKDGEPMQEDGAEDFSTMDHVYSIQDRVRALLQSNLADFNAWMLLITEVEEKSPDDIQGICLVYESFLSEFPLCYGYWTRYAGHKARLCNMNEVEEVYEQAVKAVSHSVHLWASYCSFAISSFEDPEDVRRLFERGLSYVDKDYLCHLLWDKYIEFEYAQKQWSRLAHIYINILRFPTRRLQNYYESFKKLFALLEEAMEFQNAAITPLEEVPDYEMAYSKTCGYAEISNVMDLLGQSLASPETIKKCLSLGELLYRRSSQLNKHIGCFEARIQRQYFHIKPLDEFQLENWHEYLTFIEEQGNFDWAVKLYERCLIPCASYSEFWIRYVDFVDAKGGREIANHALERASKVFLKRMPSFHLYYSMFKEKIGDMVNARAPFLQCGEDFAVDTIENVNRKANMEKRTGNIEAAQEIYDKAIKMAHEKQNLEMISLLYTNFARFTFVVTGTVSAAKEVFIKGIQQNPCKSIIEGFLDFMTLHGRMNLVDAVDSTLVTVLCPEVDASQALRSDDREEISQLYLKFVDLYGTIHELRKAWERHRKLFPHIMRPSALCDNSSTGFQIPHKKIEGPQGMPTNSPNHSCENSSRNVSIKRLVGNHSPKDKPIIPEDTLMSMLKSDDGTDKEKEIQGLVAAKAIVKQSAPEGDEIDVVNELVNEIQDVAQIPDASSEYHETEMIHIDPEKESQGNLEIPALDNLSINSPDFVNQQANTIASHDNNAPQEVTSNDGNKPKDDDKGNDVSLVHSSGMQHLQSDTNSQAKPQESSSFSHPASHVTSPGTKTNLRPQAQQQVNANQALPVNVEYPQTAAGGSWSQVYYGPQVLTDPNSMLHGQQWQAYAQMQNQSAGANSPMPVSQSYVSLAPSLSNTQDLQVGHTQLQYQLAAAQAYMNPGIALLGQHIQQPAIVYTQAQQIQQASSQTQVQAYQHVPQIDEQYGYYQSVQGFPPHIWQYYQNLYYLQQQQLQQRQQDQQVNSDSQKQQMTDLPQQRSSQQEMLENQEEQDQVQVRPDTPRRLRDLDNEQNATKLQQNQQEKQEEPTQSKLQSLQSVNSEQSQLLYLQQQQQFYLQQQQQQQMYLQQQQLLQQQQHQQHQQLILFQQQQLQFQHQQHQMLILPQQQQQQSQYRQQHHSPLQQQDYQEQQQTNASGLKPVESSVYSQESLSVQKDSNQQRQRKEKNVPSQGEGDPVHRVGQSLDSSSAK